MGGGTVFAPPLFRTLGGNTPPHFSGPWGGNFCAPPKIWGGNVSQFPPTMGGNVSPPPIVGGKSKTVMSPPSKWGGTHTISTSMFTTSPCFTSAASSVETLHGGSEKQDGPPQAENFGISKRLCHRFSLRNRVYRLQKPRNFRLRCSNILEPF